MASAAEVTEVLATLAAVYPSRDLTPETTAAYIGLLEDIPIDELRRAADTHMKSERWFPAPSELRSVWVDAESDGRCPEDAWIEAKGQVKAVGLMGTPRWSHVEVARAAAAVGWKALCDMTADNTSILHAQFLKAYGTFETRREQEQLHGSTDPRVQSLVGALARKLTGASHE